MNRASCVPRNGRAGLFSYADRRTLLVSVFAHPASVSAWA